MMFKIFTFVFAVLSLVVGNAQSDMLVQGKLIDKISGKGIPHVMIQIGEENRFSMTNEMGEFYIPGLENQQIYLHFSSLEVVSKTVAFTPSFYSSDTLILIDSKEWNGKDTASEVVNVLVERVLATIEENHLSQTHLLNGYYTEETWNGEALMAYGEGLVTSIKNGYKNGFDFENYYKNRKTEETILKKGFFKTINESTDFPVASVGFYLPKLNDILKSAQSPLMLENKLKFQFQISETKISKNDSISVVSFTSVDEDGGPYGEIWINTNDNSIVKSKVSLDDKALAKINLRSSKIILLGKTFTTHYNKSKDGYYLGFISQKQEYKNVADDKIITQTINYFTSSVILNPIISLDRNEILQRKQAPDSFLPMKGHSYFGGNDHWKRKDNVTRAIGSGERIMFLDLELERAIQKSQEEGKLLFIYMYGQEDKPCARMDTTTFVAQELVEYLNKNFINLKIDIDSEDGDELVYMSELEFLPGYVIMTPLGQVVEVDDGYLLPATLIEKMKSYEGFDIDRLLYSYDRVKGKSDNKMKGANRDLFLQLDKLDNPNAARFLEVYRETIKKWNSPEEKSILFKYISVLPGKKYEKLFFQNLPYYEYQYSEKEITNKIYTLGEKHAIEKNFNNPEKFKEYVKVRAPIYADSLSGVYLINYYTKYRPDEGKYLTSFFSFLNSYPDAPWEFLGKNLMSSAFLVVDTAQNEKLISVLENFKGKVPEYERLDILSVVLYRAGKKREALEMISDINRAARKAGVRYEFALRRLKEE